MDIPGVPGFKHSEVLLAKWNSDDSAYEYKSVTFQLNARDNLYGPGEVVVTDHLHEVPVNTIIKITDKKLSAKKALKRLCGSSKFACSEKVY